ncbi:MAG TPA: RNA polymerase sigma factor [Terracidiphilus sp.]|jgi:RNA polymerase sigma-70 factor, ECF subfamily|nr:RNA polymerase sigma factor [Terracidiphilus sp.]
MALRNAAGGTRAVTVGEDAEFAELVERQWRFVFRVVYAVLLNSHDAEDAVQETFLKLYRNRGWHKIENERAFLARVAWRVAIDRRPSSVRGSVPGTSESLVDSADPESLEPDPEEVLILAADHALIHSMIDALPEVLRVPLVLSSYEELNSRQIGRILGIPEGTVRTRLQRARQLLHQKLAASGQSNPETKHLREVQNA